MSLITPEFGLVFWQTVTLVVVLFVLRRFAWMPILQTIQVREETIARDLRRAKIAEAQVVQAENQKDSLLKEAEYARAKIIQDAVSVQQRMLTEARERAAREGREKMAKIERLLEVEKREAFHELQKDVVNLVIQLTEQLLKSDLIGQEKYKAFVQQLVHDIASKAS